MDEKIDVNVSCLVGFLGSNQYNIQFKLQIPFEVTLIQLNKSTDSGCWTNME